MTLVVVPVRYPLSEHSKETLSEGWRIAQERDAELTVLHVNLYQNNEHVTRSELKRAAEAVIGRQSHARYVVRSGFLVEESILDEVAAEDADVVVIGRKQASRWRRMFRRLTDDPDVERFLKESLDCEVVTVG
ncbi:universal stress protein [Halomarina litorea]|uniref:universal stress protein n=1 Tax=Halomarina litorea TaxID=2961595 RepID=UPI0020C1DC63|nr:universal stress protein [Halomarina sp. BCD28]